MEREYMQTGQKHAQSPARGRQRASLLVTLAGILLGSLGCASSTQTLRAEPGWVDTPIASPRTPLTRAQRRRAARRAANPDLVRAWRQGATGDRRLPAVLAAAEAQADPAGRRVLRTGRALVQQGKVIRGSCWTYASAVYKAAGFVGRQRTRPYKTKKAGPYADADELRPGDFVSYVNLQYAGSEHSAIFVGWLDRDEEEGLMLSYVGGRRAKPGDYRSYTLSRVYMIQRPRPAAPPSPVPPRNSSGLAVC